uniref:Peptidase S74 domain-containing protein n=1 Tax=viral metagenome TaxID=1070528 RepID=A0A6C0HJL1_9ZZZZ
MSNPTASVDISNRTTTFPTPLNFTITKTNVNYGIHKDIHLWNTELDATPDTRFMKSEYGTWDCSNQSVTTSIVTYTPTSTAFYKATPDYCNFLISLNSTGGIVFQSLRIYAYVTFPEGTLSSRFSGLNGRSKFTLNIKDEAEASLVQFYTSLGDLYIHQAAGPGFEEDARFNQTYLFGPVSNSPCDIQILNTSYIAAARSYGTAKSQMRATVFLAYSDYRLKHNVETLNKTHTVDDIRVVKYTSDDNTPHFGVIAHELAEVYPELVKGEKDEEMLQSVSYIELIPLLINEVQTIKKELITLKKENEQLAEKIEQLEHDENLKKTA